MEPEVLILYATTHGHTRKIASRIADVLRADGSRPHLCDLREAGSMTPSGFDAVIVGASVHAGHHQKDAVAWVKHHAAALGETQSAFFSVSLMAAEDTADSLRVTREYVDEFLDDTGWMPSETASFAGALQYREYDFPTQLVMRLVMRRGNHPTDVSRDYDYTDWEAVESFAHSCLTLGVRGSRTAAASWESSRPTA
jgi:menaquinone-dependent protoporphyrinogen oxidase